MAEPSIRVENLGKRYRVRQAEERGNYKRLSETIMDIAAAPLRQIRRMGQPMPANETFWALREVNFEIQAGESVGIIGRNGAGKSTLLKLISQITRPTEGRITLNGRVGSLLEVGTGFHPELTGRENIFLNGAILGMSREEVRRKFDEIVAFAEVERFIDTPVKRYSSGMYTRLAFAVAAHLEPEILVVDEVLAVGDLRFQQKSFDRMRKGAQEGLTVLFVSHNISAIKEFCRVGIFLDQGEIQAYGDVVTVTNTYLEQLAAIDSTEVSGVKLTTYILNENNQPLDHWRKDQKITLDLHFDIQKPLASAAIDIAAYTLDGARLFTLSTDYFEGGAISPFSDQVNVRISLINPGLRVPQIFFDVGVRIPFQKSRFEALFKQVKIISISSEDLPQHAMSEAIFYFPTEVNVMRKD